MQTEWAELVLAVIGAGTGGFIGLLFAAPFKRGWISLILAFLAACAGILYLPEYLDSLAGDGLRRALNESDPSQELLAELKANPLFSAILAVRPNSEDEVVHRLKKAYWHGGHDSLKREGSRLAAEFVEEVTTEVGPRAASEDLVRAVTAWEQVADYLSLAAPMLCYHWIVGQQTGKDFDATRFQAVIGPDREYKLVETFAELIRNAGPTIPTYDRKAASSGMAVAGRAGASVLGQPNLDLIAGKRPPKSEDEARKVCEAGREVYRVALAQPNASDVIRELFLNRW